MLAVSLSDRQPAQSPSFIAQKSPYRQTGQLPSIRTYYLIAIKVQLSLFDYDLDLLRRLKC